MAEELLELGRIDFYRGSYMGEVGGGTFSRLFTMVSRMESPAKNLLTGDRVPLNEKQENLVLRIEELAARQRINIGRALRGLGPCPEPLNLSGIPGAHLGDLFETIGDALGGLGTFVTDTILPTLGTIGTSIISNPELVSGLMGKILGVQVSSGQQTIQTAGQTQAGTQAVATQTGNAEQGNILTQLLNGIIPGIAGSTSANQQQANQDAQSTGLNQILGTVLSAFGQNLSLDRILNGVGLGGIGASLGLSGSDSLNLSNIMETIAKNPAVSGGVNAGGQDVIVRFDGAGQGDTARAAQEKGTPGSEFPLTEVAIGAGGLLFITTLILVATSKK
jgi:hypothetical protein